MKRLLINMLLSILIVICMATLLMGCGDKKGGENEPNANTKDKWEYLQYRLEDDKDISSINATYTEYTGTKETDTYEWRMNNGYERQALGFYNPNQGGSNTISKFDIKNYTNYTFFSDNRAINGIKFDVTASQDCTLNLEFEIRYLVVINDNTGETEPRNEIIKKDISLSAGEVQNVVVEFENSSKILYISLTNVIKVESAWMEGQFTRYNVDKAWTMQNIMLSYAK